MQKRKRTRLSVRLGKLRNGLPQHSVTRHTPTLGVESVQVDMCNHPVGLHFGPDLQCSRYRLDIEPILLPLDKVFIVDCAIAVLGSLICVLHGAQRAQRARHAQHRHASTCGAVQKLTGPAGVQACISHRIKYFTGPCCVETVACLCADDGSRRSARGCLRSAPHRRLRARVRRCMRFVLWQDKYAHAWVACKRAGRACWAAKG